jgi:adenylate cyclase
MANGNQASLATPLRGGFSRESVVFGSSAIRGQLERILTSASFRRAGRMSRFLRFVVEETLQGRGPLLKEYLIGVEVFDQTCSYDPWTDPVVRSEARRLRSKLSEYYQEEGQNDPVRIYLPKGQYAAVFETSTIRADDIRVETLATRQSAANTPSIAVLPFLNLSPNRENECFCDGLTQEIIHAIGKMTGMKVVARTSVLHYKGRAHDIRQIGAQLGVGMILEGSVRQFEDRLRVTTQLIRGSDGCSHWSESYDRIMADILAIQEEVSRSIVIGLLNWIGTAESPTVRVSSSMPLQEISPPRRGPNPSGVNLLVTTHARRI